ncbi:Ribosomal RNA small subunit methyltransferase B [Caloramator mitchellensis]|uniref:16S rRNA (cytosine(967)-C(5))-methyltransferase n=1 Tax=Caloramator mitchellensis TaxID=908809 RepID=A0A0R3K3M6_CALMK|nr:16S rRNA (cytosine(967)-C(5))-methyltransferase RsmB [Caloramator mitchellensis]KRQ86927.1 Ribosomal RNA small subunit methyltransferase B [Caloramator mitchellensis]
MKDKARYIAVKVLCDIDEKKAYSNIKLNLYFKKYDLQPIDRAFATEIVYGTIRWKLKIDYLIQKFSKIPLNKIDIWALNSIRIAIYQIFFLDKVPHFAAVNESVELSKLKDKKLSGFVNGVLRSVLRNKEVFDKIEVKDEITKLSIEYSHPEWFIKHFMKQFNGDFLKDLMAANNGSPNLTIRVNTLKCTRDELVEKLNNRGIDVKYGILDDALIINEVFQLDKLEEFNKGLFFIQDISSMLVAHILNPRSGETILDMCAAPGGKTTHLAQFMKNKGKIYAFDIYEHKLQLINENAKRLGINIIEPLLKDASIFNEEYIEKFDKILLDAPCSGLGLIRKKPEIRWNINLSDILELTKIQQILLENASRYLRIGGEMTYSTCTISKEENEDIINSFLSRNSNFELCDITNSVPEKMKSCVYNTGMIRLFPNEFDTDGFFIAKLKRKW